MAITMRWRQPTFLSEYVAPILSAQELEVDPLTLTDGTVVGTVSATGTVTDFGIHGGSDAFAIDSAGEVTVFNENRVKSAVAHELLVYAVNVDQYSDLKIVTVNVRPPDLWRLYGFRIMHGGVAQGGNTTYASFDAENNIIQNRRDATTSGEVRTDGTNGLWLEPGVDHTMTFEFVDPGTENNTSILVAPGTGTGQIGPTINPAPGLKAITLNWSANTFIRFFQPNTGYCGEYRNIEIRKSWTPETFNLTSDEGDRLMASAADPLIWE